MNSRIFCLVLALFLSAALAPARADVPITYSKDGVSFDHPAGWKVTEDVTAQDETRMRSIDLEGPNEAIVTLLFSPFFAGQDLHEFAAGTARRRADALQSNATLKGRVGPMTTAPISRKVAGQNNTGVAQRYVFKMLGQTLPHEARFFKASVGGTTVIIMTQVSDEDAQAVEPGFVMALETLRVRADKR